MQTRFLLFSLLLLGMILANCTAMANPTSDPLNGTSWSLATLNGQPTIADTQVTLNFQDRKLAGSDGCNTYSTSYSVNGTKITINENIATSLMACSEPIMQQASEYTAVLTQTTSYEVEGSQLTFFDKSGKELATFTMQSKDLGATSWLVTGYNNGKQAVVSVISGTELTAEFTTDGKLGGSAGCNRYTATYEVTGQSIKIGPAASTRMMCSEPAGVMEQEAQYLLALETAATYRIDGSKLELRTADGALAVSFTKANPATTSPAETSQLEASIWQALLNLSYPLPDISSGNAQLKDGVFEEQAAPGSATMTRVELADIQSLGDVNGDGVEDAAVLLVVDPGGSGTFYYLTLVVNVGGSPKPVASILLGDRVVVKSIVIQSGEVVVNMITRKPDEPMSAQPSVEVLRKFKLQGNNLVEVD